MRDTPSSVDEYLSALPEDQRDLLEDLRRAIKTAVPTATEVISYKIPTFKYKGKALVAFSASKKHVSFHLMSPPLMKTVKDDLRGFDTTTATIRFTADNPLPPTLVKKLIKARITEQNRK